MLVCSCHESAGRGGSPSWEDTGAGRHYATGACACWVWNAAWLRVWTVIGFGGSGEDGGSEGGEEESEEGSGVHFVIVFGELMRFGAERWCWNGRLDEIESSNSMGVSESDSWWVQMKVPNLRVRKSASYRCMADDRAEGFF